MPTPKKKAAAKRARTKGKAQAAAQHDDTTLLAASPGTVGRGLNAAQRRRDRVRQERKHDPVASGDVEIESLEPGEMTNDEWSDPAATRHAPDPDDTEVSLVAIAAEPDEPRLGSGIDPNGATLSEHALGWAFLDREYWEPERCRPAEYNVIRSITDEAFTELKRGIERFGLLGGLDARAEDGLLIGGHQRFKACRELIEKHRDNPKQLAAMNLPDGRIPVNPIAGMSDADAAVLNVRLNNPAAQGRYDLGNLAEFLSELDANGVDATLTGFNGDALEAILTFEAEPQSIREEDEDADVTPRATSETPTGALFQLGRHRLIVGDAADPTVWLDLLDDGAGETVQLDGISTDPPYGVNYVGGTAEALTIENDNADEATLEREVVGPALRLAHAHCRPGAAWYVFAPGGPLFFLFAKIMRELAVWRETLSWVKDRFVLGRQDYHWREEPMLAGEVAHPDEQRGKIPERVKKEAEKKRQPIVYGWKDGARHYFVDDRTQDTLWLCERPSKNAEHPTMKPVELYRRMYRNSSTPGARWADCFAGSGGAFIAGEQTGRIIYGIEKDPRYADVIVRRWEQHTEQKAERIR